VRRESAHLPPKSYLTQQPFGVYCDLVCLSMTSPNRPKGLQPSAKALDLTGQIILTNNDPAGRGVMPTCIKELENTVV
jgi:hypothetical protein